MKKQRIQNPRFLGALGALGALGLFGCDRPEVQRWAALAWLSLISLLVLLPTVDVNSKWAEYRLHPRRKGFLFFLLFLGFLGFFFTDDPSRATPAVLAVFAQFSIQVKKNPFRKSQAPKAILVGLAFMVFMLIGVSAELGMVVGVLILPTMLAFRPVVEGRDRFPLGELVPIFMLLFAAIILPAGGLFWFMNQAMNNEKMAVRQRLIDVYEVQLQSIAGELDTLLDNTFSRMGAYTNLPPSLHFRTIWLKTVADAVLVMDERGHLIYPEQAVLQEGFEPSPEGIAIKEQVKRLLKEKRYPDARAVIEHMQGNEELYRARDDSGHWILPALQLFYLDSLPKEQQGNIVHAFRKSLEDYAMEMPSARRIFYLQNLTRFDPDSMLVELWVNAELLTMEISEYFDELPLESAQNGILYVPEKGLHIYINEHGRDAVVFRSERLIPDYQKEFIDKEMTVKGLRVVLQRRSSRPGAAPLVSVPATSLGGDWVLDLYNQDETVFAMQAKHRRKVHFAIGMALVCMMGVISGLLVRSLLAQQRLTQMKIDFVATVTHELKTPLASTRMLVDTLLEGRCTSEMQQHEYLELIARENKRLARLIDNFLTFSRMERNKRSFTFEAIAPGDIAQTAIETVHENYEQCGCKLTVDIDENLPPIVADRDSMVQVLLNLLDNACKYSDGDKRIQLSVFEKENAVCFQVEDNGIGMAKRELSKIMDRFYQVDQSMTRKVGGAGLGLSIVKFIVDAHGGKIDIESESGKGSAFTVILPVVN